MHLVPAGARAMPACAIACMLLGLVTAPISARSQECADYGCLPIVGSVATPYGGSLSVALAGNYAYVAGASGLQTVDISDPFFPTIAGGVATAEARGVAVAGNYAYLACNPSSLWVVDISSPGSPAVVASSDLPGNMAYAVAVSGSYAYIGTHFSDKFGGVLNVMDISDPASPGYVGYVNTVS